VHLLHAFDGGTTCATQCLRSALSVFRPGDALAQAPADVERYRLEAEKIEAERTPQAQIVRHVGEAAYLLLQCADAFDLSQTGLKALESVARGDWLAEVIHLDRQPNRPNKPRACFELLTRYGPEGTVERGWIQKRQ
jgi:hypothetical protein